MTSNHDSPGAPAPQAGRSNQGAGGTAASGGMGTAGAVSTGGALSLGGAPPAEPCKGPELPFADQVVVQAGKQRVFYSWTTDEQVAELRAGGELFSRSERPGEGRGLLFDSLAAYAEAGASDTAKLAGTLVTETFTKARFAWPNPWATVLGRPGETYGNQLLRIELSADAWVASFDGEVLDVFDVNNQPVPIETALAAPARIGAIFHVAEGEIGGPYCGTFRRAGFGLREFALGNLAMVKRWSLATEEIAERLRRDIAELQAFQAQLVCLGDTSSWSADLICEWGRGFTSGGLLANYDFALGLPSDLYRPTTMNLEALIATLEASLPTGEPLVVSSGE